MNVHLEHVRSQKPILRHRAVKQKQKQKQAAVDDCCVLRLELLEVQSREDQVPEAEVLSILLDVSWRLATFVV